MTAEEIRAIKKTAGPAGLPRDLTVQEIFLREIAAELADMNDQIRGIICDDGMKVVPQQ